MKFAVALLAVLATTGSMAIKVPNLGRGQLHKDLQEFVDAVPVNSIVAIVLEYFSEDAEFQAAVAYLQSAEFKQLAQDVEAIPEVIDLMNYIYSAGVDIYYLVNKLNEFIGLAKLVPPPQLYKDGYKITGGIAGLIKDIKAVLPIEKLQALYKHKLETSKAFADLIARLSSPQFQKIVNTVYGNPNFQKLLAKAKAAGIDVKAIKDLLYAILGIKVPTKPYNYVYY